MNSICMAPPRYQLPCSQYGPTLPTPAPKPCTFMAAKPGWPSDATAGCHSAVDEHPVVPELAVGPRLLGQVVHRLVAVGDRRAENVVVAFGVEMPALVLPNVGVAALDRCQNRAHVGRHAVAHVPEVEVVGRLDEDDRHLAGGILRAIDVGRQPHAVLHRDHHAPFDDGDVLEFGFEILAALLLGRRERALLRGKDGRGENRDRD